MLEHAYLYIFTMAAVTFLIRALPLTLIRRPIRNRLVRSFGSNEISCPGSADSGCDHLPYDRKAEDDHAG